MMQAILFGSVLGVALAVLQLSFTSWKWWAVVVPLALLHTVLRRP